MSAVKCLAVFGGCGGTGTPIRGGVLCARCEKLAAGESVNKPSRPQKTVKKKAKSST